MGTLGHNKQMKEAGELLAVETIDRTGLAVTSEGAFVRVLQVTPPNPLILSEEERARIAHGYCQLVSRLRADQRLQFYVHSRPVKLKEVLAAARHEVECVAGPPPASLEDDATDELARSRWRLYAAMEQSLRLHADDQAAVETSYYVVCPHVPPRRGRRELLRELKPRRKGLLSGPMSRPLKAHRRAARESLAFAETIRTELDSLSIPSRLLGGEEFSALLWERFNPTQADRAVNTPQTGEVVGDLDRPVEQKEARTVAERLRALIARSPIDFDRSHHHVEIDHDVEQAIWVATTAENTQVAWLMGPMMSRQPFTLSVHVKALDRRRERNRLKMRYRRVYAINRGAEARGRVPDFDRYAQEQETSHLLRDMAGSDRASLFDLSIYLTLRAPGPNPDLAALAEAVDFCAEALTSTSDAAVNRGAHHQRRLWPSTLPLGRDIANYSRVYATQNIGDCVPLAGTSCGSPVGVPFAFAAPGRSLERLDPLDRTLDNQTVLMAGKSGAGKTMIVLTLLSRMIAQGVGPVFVIDKANHFLTLTRLVHGANYLDIGSEDSEWAINHWDTPDQAAVPREKVAFLLALHGALMGEEGLSVLERSQLASAIRQVYSRAHQEGVQARESMLHTILLERANQETTDGAVEVAVALRNLAERLGEFCGDGAYSYLLDRETTIPTDSPLVVFNTEKTPEAILGAVMLSIVEYVTRQVKRHHTEHAHLANQPGVPRLMLVSVLVVDEAWHKVANPEAGVYLADLARRARHIGLLLWVLSQALMDLNTQHGLPLLNNHGIVMMLKQISAQEIDFSRDVFALSDEQSGIIKNLHTVHGRYSEVFWMNGGHGMGRSRFAVGPTEYWAFTNEPLRETPARNAMIAAHDGKVWQAICDLAHRGVPTGNDE